MKSKQYILPFKKGFSLIEMLLVLGVLAVLLIAAFVIYPRVREAAQTSTEIKNISLIGVGLSNYFESKGSNYISLGESTAKTGNIFAIQSKIIPSSMIDGEISTGGLKNSWGGEVSIFSTTDSHSGSSPGRSYGIRYYSVPSSSCVKMVTDASTYFPSIIVSGKNVVTDHTYTMSYLMYACNDTSNPNVTFVGH